MGERLIIELRRHVLQYNRARGSKHFGALFS
jgi:hypothetical protein